jgi:hypothetical protein
MVASSLRSGLPSLTSRARYWCGQCFHDIPGHVEGRELATAGIVLPPRRDVVEAHADCDKVAVCGQVYEFLPGLLDAGARFSSLGLLAGWTEIENVCATRALLPAPKIKPGAVTRPGFGTILDAVLSWLSHEPDVNRPLL